MRQVPPNPNATDSVPSSDASYRGGTAGSLSGASAADLKRGFTTDNASQDYADKYGELPDEPLKGGFLGRAKGWER